MENCQLAARRPYQEQLKPLSDKENESVDNWDGKLTELACASQSTFDPASALININTKTIFFFSINICKYTLSTFC